VGRYLYIMAALIVLIAGSGAVLYLAGPWDSYMRYRELRLRFAGYDRREMKAPYGTFYYYLNHTADGAAPVMFLHGLGMSGEQWASVLRDMGDSRPISAIEFLGFGRSPELRVSDDEYGIELFVRQVEDLRRELGWDNMILAGVSMGGWVAAEYTLEHPDRVAGLLLMAAAGLAPDVPKSDLRKTLEDFDYKTPREFRHFVNTYMVYKPLYIPDFVGRLALGQPQRGYRLFLKNVERQPWPSDRTAALQAPTALVWGKQDRLFPFDIAVYLSQRIPDSRLFPVDKAGHALLFTQPRRARAVIREAFAFLDGRLGQK